MNLPRRLILTLPCLLAGPLLAQPQIGGNTCTSATLSGIYGFTLTGRQVTSAGNFSNVLQANGSANFDGLSKVTIALATDTIQAVGTPATWAGTYTMQANCAGLITITSGGSAALNLVAYNQGVDFLVTGNDAIYTYSGSGDNQPSGCSASTFSGVYFMTSTGYSLASGTVSGAESGTGLLQFDGVGSITANLNTSVVGKAPTALTLTGSYSISGTCVGSATLTDSTKTNTYVMSLSITNSAAANGAFYVALAQNGKLLLSGSGNAVYGQPTTAAALQIENVTPQSTTGRGL